VVTVSSGLSNVVLDGFTITAGNTSGAAAGSNHGGGMLITDSSPTLSNLLFSNNRGYDGGGLYV
jgi:hypothetical protein